MNKELQDKAWSVLPKEFKEEVKKYFAHYRCAINTYEAIINHIFGLHNLTSDAEGEEMLTVPRKKVQEMWQRAYKQESQYSRTQDSSVAREELYYNRGIMSIIDTLFGSKCLPDESVSEVASETKSETDKHFDNILKDSFRNERRLNIAAMAMQGIVSNPTAMNGPKLIDGDEEILAKWSLKFADALIAECEKGGKS